MQFHVTWILPILYLMVLLYSGMSQTRGLDEPIPLRLVKGWARDFGKKLFQLTKNVTAINKLSKEYETFGVSVRKIHGEMLVQKLAKEMENMLQKKVSAVKKLADAAEKAILTYKYKKDIEFDYFNAKKVIPDTVVKNLPGGSTDPSRYRVIHLNQDKHFNDLAVNYSTSTVHVPTNVYDQAPNIVNGIAWSDALDKQFRENAKNDSTLLWQYFGSSTGFFRIYPGMIWPRNNKGGNVDTFDCRVRGWYIQAATFPKDMVILLDSSGSMKGLRMAIARSTVGKILETLSDNDFFNIITFNKEPGYLDTCLNRTLLPANTDNRDYMRKALYENVTTRDMANFEAALIEAFELFGNTRNKSKGTGCYSNKVIMLITDGAPENYEWVFEKYNWGPNNTVFVRVFTYLIGREVSDSRQTHWMACVNKGYPTRISTLADVQENVQKYITVLSRPTQRDAEKNIAWSPAYLNYINTLKGETQTEAMIMEQKLHLMTSIAQPVFDKRNDTDVHRKLLGVVGTDVLISDLTKLTSQFLLGVNGYSFVVTNNGYLLFHPELKPLTPKGKNPKYRSIVLTDVEFAKKAEELKISMINREKGSMKIRSRKYYEDMKRVVVRNTNFFYAPIGRSDIPFSLAIALPTGYGEAFISAFADVSNYDPRHFEGAGVEIAPWPYCVDMDRKPKDGKCLDTLLKYLELGKAGDRIYRKKCSTDMVESLLFDASVTSRMHQFWIGRRTPERCSYLEGAWCSVEHLKRSGVELVFMSTRTGLTRFMKTTENLTDVEFLSKNMNSLEDLYYKRAVDIGSGNVVFSLPIVKENYHDANRTMVTVSTPLLLKRDNDSSVSTVAAVLGYQMKYLNFRDAFLSVVERCPMDKSGKRLTRCGNWKCSNPDLECYLIDDNGFVMYASNEKAIGLFFAEIIQYDIFRELIKKRIFKGVSVWDGQSICETISEEGTRSPASVIITPFKWMASTVMWSLKELAVFIAEWGLLTWFSENHAVEGSAYMYTYEEAELDPEEYLQEEGEEFTDSESSHWDKVMYGGQSAFNKCQIRQMAAYFSIANTEKPCFRNATLYTANYKELPKNTVIKNCHVCLNYTEICMGAQGAECMRKCQVKGDKYSHTQSLIYLQRPMDPMSLRYHFVCLLQKNYHVCEKQYIVERVEHTNLLMVVIDPLCYCEPADPITILPDVTFDDKDTLCDKLRDSKHLQRPDQPCPDMEVDEKKTKCGGAVVTISHTLVTIQLMILLLSSLALS